MKKYQFSEISLCMILVVRICEVASIDAESSVSLMKRNVESKCEYFCNEVNDASIYVPPTFTDNCPPQNLSHNYTVLPGKKYVILNWTEPIAIDQHGNKTRVEQIDGIKNGGIFNGSVNGQRHQIVYKATDRNGLKDNCNVVIYVSIPECPRLDSVVNGQYMCTDGRSPGSSCMFTCNRGFTLNEIGNITCKFNSQTSPTWSGIRRCEGAYCGEPTVPKNANLSCTNGDNGYNSVCHVQCSQGYTPSGPLYMICKKDGFWSETTYCIRNEVESQCNSTVCNGHNCILTSNQTIRCRCSNGWTGQRCTQPPEYCRHNICMNSRICKNNYLAYYCSCLNGFSGLLCHISQVNGAWSDWTSWSSCSQTCESGIQKRDRFCDNPSPGPGGKKCQGEGFDSKPCHLSKCKVCPPLKHYNGSRSTYHCQIFDNYGQEKCRVICENGTLLLPQFKQFDEIACGWSTNNTWIPVNIQPSCVAPVPPKVLRLVTDVAYTSLIPEELKATFKEKVLAHLQPSDCFMSTMTNCDALVQFSTISNQTGSVNSKLTITFQIILQPGIKKRSTALDQEDDASRLQVARHILEETAEFIKKYMDLIFDFRLAEKDFISDKMSLNISTSIDCEEGSASYNDMCVTCPVGTSATNQRCEFCEKGYYQDKKGQTKCEACPAAKTTVQPGAIRPYECSEPTEEVITNSLDEAMVNVTVVVALISSIFTLITAILGCMIIRNKYREKHITLTSQEQICQDNCCCIRRCLCKKKNQNSDEGVWTSLN